MKAYGHTVVNTEKFTIRVRYTDLKGNRTAVDIPEGMQASILCLSKKLHPIRMEKKNLTCV